MLKSGHNTFSSFLSSGLNGRHSGTLKPKFGEEAPQREQLLTGPDPELPARTDLD